VPYFFLKNSRCLTQWVCVPVGSCYQLAVVRVFNNFKLVQIHYEDEPTLVTSGKHNDAIYDAKNLTWRYLPSQAQFSYMILQGALRELEALARSFDFSAPPLPAEISENWWRN
jgi:hypothetical protein